jgi:hypothetical protein
MFGPFVHERAAATDAVVVAPLGLLLGISRRDEVFAAAFASRV